jgi:copper homeostasis protein (lipoprotein)
MPKKLLLACCLVAIVFCACRPAAKTPAPSGDNSMTSLDWPGIYYGILPCADCEGIETVIHLKQDKTYSLQSKYLGKTNNMAGSTGTFNWNKAGNKITLSNEQPGVYLVGENKLVHLDSDGKTISGALAEKYVLLKKMPGIAEKYWKLTELYGKPVVVTAGMKKEPYMILKAENNRVNISGGCNTYMGLYELKSNNQISFGKLAGTLMACDDMTVESEFMKAISEADNYFVDEQNLVLHKAKMAPLARFEVVYFQ